VLLRRRRTRVKDTWFHVLSIDVEDRYHDFLIDLRTSRGQTRMVERLAALAACKRTGVRPRVGRSDPTIFSSTARRMEYWRGTGLGSAEAGISSLWVPEAGSRQSLSPRRQPRPGR